jgi:iron complex outermembrane recepter protein
MLSSVASALAQKAENNAITTASDAFGTSVGTERIGLYTNDEARGFNPIEAGNARIEGLYFDQQERVQNRLLDGSTVRVGITAQGLLFPAPTGLVDHRLKSTQGDPSLEIEVERAAFGGVAAFAQANLPLAGDRLVLMTFGGFRRLAQPQGGENNFRGYGGLLRWRPTTRIEMTAAHGGFEFRDEDPVPQLFPAGDTLPPDIRRGQFLGQDWDRRRGGTLTSAFVVKATEGDWRIEAGLFRSIKRQDETFSDLLRGVRSDGSVAARTIIADGDNRDRSVSGEARLTRQFLTGPIAHGLTMSLRGRGKTRVFGGQAAIALGPSTVLAPDRRLRQPFVLGPNDVDQTKQLTFGSAYRLVWPRRATLDVGISKTNYRKTVVFGNPTTPGTRAKSSPVLFNIGGSLNLAQPVTLYGGYVRGLEECLIAPEAATNRGNAPPALLTEQMDGGVRLALPRTLTLVAGLFMIRKPYFGLDAASRFGQLGDVTVRGAEISLAGRPAKGLTLISGLVVQDARISGPDVDAGRIGARPVGSVRRRAVLNIDWRPANSKRWSFDANLESTSARVGNLANRLFAPPLTTLAIGGRYRFQISGADVTTRLQATNVFDAYGWLVSNSGGFTYSPGRSFIAQVEVGL